MYRVFARKSRFVDLRELKFGNRVTKCGERA